MHSNLISGILNRSNLARFVLLSIGLIAAVGAALPALNAYRNLLTGPFTVTNEAILNLQSVEDAKDFYVTVTGEEGIDTGYGYEYVSDNVVQSTTSFAALLMGDRLLLVAVPGTVNEEIKQYTGVLISIDDETQREVIDDIVREYPELDGAFLPFLLNTEEKLTNTIVGLIAVVLTILFCTIALILTFALIADPKRHQIMKDLERFGEVEQVVQQIEMELDQDHGVMHKRTHLTRHWLVYYTQTNLAAARIADITWGYKFIQRTKAYGVITVSKDVQAIIWDKHGKKMMIRGKENQVNEILTAVAQYAPWMILGYTDELKNVWEKDRERFLLEVEHRKQQLKTESKEASPSPVIA